MANGVADIFDRFADFPAGLAETFFCFAACIVSAAFIGQFPIVKRSADSFLGFAFSLIQFAFNFIPIW